MEQFIHPTRSFSATAEQFANFALTNPVVPAGDVMLALHKPRGFANPATLTLPDGTIIDGFAKSATAAGAGRQVLAGQLATQLEAPLVPYLLLRGDSGFRRIKDGERHEADLTLFSAAPFDRYSEWNVFTDEAAVRRDLRDSDMLQLGGAGQFRAWLRDGNFYWLNLLIKTGSGAVALIDPEEADPAKPGFDEQSTAFIKDGWDACRNAGKEAAYLDGAALMAERIRALPTRWLDYLVDDNRAAGLTVEPRFVNGLLRSRGKFDTPVLLPAAKRADARKSRSAPNPKPV